MARSWFVLAVLGAVLALASDDRPEILRLLPTSGPEGARVEIIGRNLQQVTDVLFATTSSAFKSVSPEKIIAIVPHRAVTWTVTVRAANMRASSPVPLVIVNDPRVPEEVSYKAGYINSHQAASGFSSVMLWGIAIADTRVKSYESALIEVARMQLSCTIKGRDVALIDDIGKLHGGLYRRIPWFASNQAEPMPSAYDAVNRAVILPVGQRSDRVWHFWSASPRPTLPPGRLEGCTVKVSVKISDGALVQVGMDYWRNSTIPYAPGNNHEAGVSNWYFPSERWQEAFFTDIGGPAF
ncbi:MAG: hypothetical protein JOZ80_01165 [Acidobacteriaceae bacterium]|nr:hypothetical protein [Acidobacteriaceae bacterium]